MQNLNTAPLTVLSRRAANETPVMRWHRLAAKARAGGCQIVWPSGDGWIERVGVTSATTVGLTYMVELGPESCPCLGFQKCGYCCHVALVREVLGTLPEGPLPVAVAA